MGEYINEEMNASYTDSYENYTMAHSNAWIGLRFLWYPSVFPGK
jgi:hypothetical protein